MNSLVRGANSVWVIPVLLLAAAVGIAVAGQFTTRNTFEDVKLLVRGMDTPTIWLYYDNTHVNSRWWADFGARSSRVLNLPFLNLCYQTIAQAAGDRYHIEVISGLEDAARRLGGWSALPPLMRNKRTPLREEEYTYLKVAFLEQFGGLWIQPSTIFIRPLPKLPEDKVVFFGTDPLETYNGGQLPNQHMMWSPEPHHPVFKDWKENLRGRIEGGAGGRQIRHDKNWDLVFAASGHTSIVRHSLWELGRKASGRKIELEDLLASGTGGALPFDIPAEAKYVPIPLDELLSRRMFGWFLRLNEQQIMSSDLAITYLFKMGGIDS